MKVYSDKSAAVAPPLRIYVGTTAIHFRAMKNGNIGNGVNLSKFIQTTLLESEYDYRLSRWLPTYRYCTYDEENSMAYLPRYALDKLEMALRYLGVPYELIQEEPYTPRMVKIPLKKNVAPRENQVEIIDFLSDPELNFQPVSAQTSIGKALANNTPVKIPGGWKPIGELKVGDTVIAQDGTPSKVIGVYPQGKKELWLVRFRDERWVLTDEEHQWTVYTPASFYSKSHYGEPFTISTREIASLLRIPSYKNRIHIPLIQGEQGEDKDFLIDPYVLGVFVGDGCLSHNQLKLDTDEWIIRKVISRLPGCDCTIRRYDDYQVDYACSASFKKLNPVGQKLKQHLQQYGLMGKRAWEKSIPPEYLEGSYNQRLELIRGLMDTDGYISDPSKSFGRHGEPSHCGVPEFSTTSYVLARQFQRLIWSVGGSCTLRIKTPFYTYKGQRLRGRTAYIIHFRIRNLADLVTLPRKQKNAQYPSQYAHKLRLGVTSVTKTAMTSDCTCIEIDHPSKLYVIKDYIATHNTFCSIAASSKYGMVTMIVLGLLIPQWYKSLRQFTQLSTADIYVVQGFNTLKKLWDMFKEGYRPKVIIFATRTLLLYAQSKTDSYDDLPSYREFQHQFGIGVKIIDEVHLGFNTNVLIDLYSNIKHNIYLSATYGRSNYTGKRIFNTVFPPELVYGSQVRKKYTAIYSVSYSLGLGGTVEDKVRTLKGYNHARYENYVMRIKELKQDYMTRVIPSALTEFYLNRHQPQFKVLVLCQTQKFAECIYKAITEYMTKYTFTDAKGKKHKRSIGLFFSGTTKQEELTKDIVVSTVKSCGTGMDLKGLICCINTVSFSSSVLSVQMVGRLREIPGEETVFVDLWCRDVPSHHRHIAARMNEYTKIAKRVATSEL